MRGGSPVSGLTAGRGADSKRTIREITDSGLPDKAQSLFQDARGQMWVGTQSGVAFLKSDRFVPVASVPYGIVYSFTEDSAGNLWMSHQEGLFHLLQERVVERIPWAQLGRREPAMLYSMMLCRVVYGSGFVTVALLISRTVSSAPRTQAPKGWEREWSAASTSMGAVHSGPQLRAG